LRAFSASARIAPTHLEVPIQGESVVRSVSKFTVKLKRAENLK
jgi:hypothetical protein